MRGLRGGAHFVYCRILELISTQPLIVSALPLPAPADAEAPAAPLPDEQVVLALSALAHPVRLRIFRALVVVGDPGLTPGAMGPGVDVAPATLSHHLKDLMHAGLVTQERQGRHLVYRAAFGRMNQLLAYLTRHCCEGQPCAVTTASTAGRDTCGTSRKPSSAGSTR